VAELSGVQKKAEEHFEILDLVRGLLAFWVLAGHAAIYGGTSIAPFPGPAAAVDCFMLLSGFLITYIYWERSESENWANRSTWLRFYLRRFFRIAPVYYILLICAFALAGPMNELAAQNAADNPRSWSDEKFVDPARTKIDWINFLVHLTFVFGLIPAFASNNALPDWSIGLEMQFYAVFPFLMLFFRRIGFVVPAILFTIVYLNAPSLFGEYLKPGLLLHFGQPSFLPLKINIFFIGMLLGEARYRLTHLADTRGYQLIALALVLCFFGQRPVIQFAVIATVLWTFASLPSASVSLRKLFSWVASIARIQIFKYLADASYSVYLVHLMILKATSGLLSAWQLYADTDPQIRWWLLLALAALISYAIAWPLYRWIEKPGILLGKWLVSKIGTGAPGANQSARTAAHRRAGP
jgi:peptidoglycan/LPS O-acetylase OafA/YrhL